MRNVLRVIFFCAFLSFSGAQAGAQNLLSNSGFETAFSGSDVGNWIAWGGAERLNWQAYAGSYALALKGSWSGYT